MQKTSIEWTAFSANPLKYRRKSDGKVVWACIKTSQGCANCYSEAIALRFERGKLFNARNMEELEPFLDDAELRKMLTAKTVGGVTVSGSRCFVGDMTDVFGEWVPDALLDQLFAVFALRPDVAFQVLTKRAGRMLEYMTSPVRLARLSDQMWPQVGREGVAKLCKLPLPNVWLGTSVEDQARAGERIPLLLETPAAIKFLSCEPLLGPVSVQRWLGRRPDMVPEHGVDWVICGGESGPHARPCNVEWVRSLVRQCRAAGVACFVKQLGARPFRQSVHSGNPVEPVFPLPAGDRKGGDMAEWPEDLRVRSFPNV